MTKFNRIALCFAMVISASAFAAPTLQGQQVCKGIAEKNNMRIPLKHGDNTGLSEAQFNQIMDRMLATYSDEIKSLGGTYSIERLWTDATVNAFATRQGQAWTIHMYGGLARHPMMTMDAMTLVACHETGHIIGSAPHATFSNMANEGEADYFGSLKCLRKVFATDDAGNAQVEAMMMDNKVDSFAKSECEKEFTTHADQVICMRSAMAGLQLATVLGNLRQEATPPSFTTPDPKQVLFTSNDHPPTQCRLDTYFNASRCPVPASEAVSSSNYRAGTCDKDPTYNTGSRPHCWFHHWF